MKTVIMDLVSTVSEIGSEEATRQLNQLLESEKAVSFAEGKEAAQNQIRYWTDFWASISTTVTYAIGGGIAVLGVCWAVTGVAGCNSAEAKAQSAKTEKAAKDLEACKRGDYGICMQAYKDTGDDTKQGLVYASTYKEATGKSLLPDPPTLDFQKTDTGYLLRSKDFVIDVKRLPSSK